jgi:hypothetical protein
MLKTVRNHQEKIPMPTSQMMGWFMNDEIADARVVYKF